MITIFKKVFKYLPLLSVALLMFLCSVHITHAWEIQNFSLHAPGGSQTAQSSTTIRTRIMTNSPSQSDFDAGFVFLIVYELKNISDTSSPSFFTNPRVFFSSNEVSQGRIERFDSLKPDTEYEITARLYKTEIPENLSSIFTFTFLNQLELLDEGQLQTATLPSYEVLTNCYIESVDYNLRGPQEDTFWKRNNRPVVTFTFTGSLGCQNTPFQFQLYQANRKQDANVVSRAWSTVTDVFTLDNPLAAEEVSVEYGNSSQSELSLVTGSDNTVTLSLLVGDNECKALRVRDAIVDAFIGGTSALDVLFGAVGIAYECEYTFKINDSRDDNYWTMWKPLGFTSNPLGDWWNLRYNACDADTNIVGASVGLEEALFGPCDLKWEISQIYPHQENGELITISNASIFSQDPACLDENNQPIPNCYALLEPLPGISRIDENTTIGEYLNIIIRLFIGLLGLFAVIMIVVGGIQYMSTDAISGKSEGRDRITKALLGLLLALGSFTILNTINPDLTVIDPNASVDLLEINVTASGDIETGGDAIISQANLSAVGPVAIDERVHCPREGGSSVVRQVAESFQGNVTYQMGGKNATNQAAQCSPDMCLDCSGFAHKVLYCSGIIGEGSDTVYQQITYNNNTTNMFSHSSARRIEDLEFDQGDWFVYLQGESEPRALRAGDILGWTSAEPNENVGHVVVYIGNGQIAESVSGIGYRAVSVETYWDNGRMKSWRRY